jgi:hypothetical protein
LNWNQRNDSKKSQTIQIGIYLEVPLEPDFVRSMK